MRPIFDSYLMVDWSASGKPRTGKDSIWISLAAHGAETRLWNPATRVAASALIADLLNGEIAADRRVLAGFDFPFGFPKGATQIMCGGNWRTLWDHFDVLIREGDNNANSRFDAAAILNAAFGDAGGPFWGNALKRNVDGLPRLKPHGYGQHLPARLRRVESTAKGTQEVWKLSGAGSVGSQTLTGLAALSRLRRDPRLVGKVAVWPLETGFEVPVAPVVLVEIYPSLVEPDPCEVVKDAGQVRAISAFFARHDATGALQAFFAPPPSLDTEAQVAAASEEAWIFGAEAAIAAQPTREPRSASPTRSVPHYLRDPAAIYAASFAIVRAEARLERFPANLQNLVIRLIHSCGMVEIADRLAFSPNAISAGQAALTSGKPILCDAEMVASGIIRRHLPANNPVIVTLNDPNLPDIANTRSAAAVELWLDKIEGAVVAIGNAPTALFHLLELLDLGWPRPALILGFPVGFVGAAESKSELANNPRGCEFITLKGRKGGSAVAAAAVNALAGGLK